MSKNGRGSDDKRIALVIGSGAVKCAAALGLWKVLIREGIHIDLFVGCSGGSLFTATMAVGFEVEECIDKTQRLWNREITEKRHWSSMLRAILPGLRFDERFGMIDDRALVQSLRTVFGESSFEDATAPLYVVAIDFHSGEQVVFSEGKLLDALRASVSIPYIWPPWQIGDRLYVDGSLSNPMPVDVAIKEGGDIIVAMGFELPIRSRMHSYTSITAHFNSIYMNNILKSTFSFYNLAHHAEVIAILPEFERQIGTFDGDQTAYIIERGRQATEQQLPYLNRLIGNDV